MARRIIQDVIPTQRKSIRDIPLPHAREQERVKRQEDVVIKVVREKFEHRHGNEKKFKRWGIAIGVVVLLVALFFIMNAFAHATVSVVLASQSDAVDSSLVANSATVASSTGTIADSIISITKQGSLSLTATTTQDVETKATGSIIVFNDYSTAAQKLVANTRFETSSGLIYRISKSVSVPGKTTKAGVTTPGSVTVTVTADQVGTKYNIDLSDFTVPGFTGEPQFDGIFARSKTVMAGGFSGTEPVISSATRSTAEASIRAHLATELFADASSSVPDGYILYPNAESINYTSLSDTVGSGNTVTINEQGVFTGFALNVSAIDTALAGDVVKSYSGEPITVANLSALTFSTNALPTATSSALSFTLSGTAKFIWSIDAGTFSAQLAGKPKSDFTAILQGYPHVDKASVSFFPFWLGSFPSNPSAITIATTTSI